MFPRTLTHKAKQHVIQRLHRRHETQPGIFFLVHIMWFHHRAWHHVCRRTLLTMSRPRQTFRKDTINPSILEVEYAVRGEIPTKAAEYERRLETGEKLPFGSIVWTNIGNPQQQPMLGQEPITFWRQVASLTEYPQLLDLPAHVRDATFPPIHKSARVNCLMPLEVLAPIRHRKVCRWCVSMLRNS